METTGLAMAAAAPQGLTSPIYIASSPWSSSSSSSRQTSWVSSSSIVTCHPLPRASCWKSSLYSKNLRNEAAGKIVAMAPEDEKMTRRSPLDFPLEWDRPRPGRRPDIMPQFSPMKTPLPPPLPTDPPEEDEEEDEKKEEENPDEENPEE